MQTFLPSSNFERSAFLLDDKRLGKQRVENLQIMKALTLGGGWKHHPAVKMWRGYEWTLLAYQKAICDEWVEQGGHADSCLIKTMDLYFAYSNGHDNHQPPPWLGRRDFHISHQSNLIRKDPLFYKRYFPRVPDNLPYVWPVQ